MTTGHAAFIGDLRAALRAPLPGHDAFLARAGYKRSDIEASLRNDPEPRQSAVLVLLFPRAAQLHTLLMLRPDYEGVHGGQISFPGGRKEEGDADHWGTALREFHEETGIELQGVTQLGELSRVYIPPSRSMVIPCVAFSPDLGAASPDPREVAALMEIPLDRLMADDVVKHREQFIHVANGKVLVPYFDLLGHVVWGATAMMLWELREVLKTLTGSDAA